jgi:hypothetical protein
MDKQWIAFVVVVAVIAAATPFVVKSLGRMKRTKGTAQLFWALFFGFAFLNNRELTRIEDARDEHKRKPPDPGGDRPTTRASND